jgi:hypothetical protein
MAHFAEIDENNTVLRLIVINDSDCLDAGGNEWEAVGANFCHNLLGGTWKQTSYNHNVRKNYACVGAEYREDLDAFIHPTPFASWVLNETTCKWEAPRAYPSDGFDHYWSEKHQNWARK